MNIVIESSTGTLTGDELLFEQPGQGLLGTHFSYEHFFWGIEGVDCKSPSGTRRVGDHESARRVGVDGGKPRIPRSNDWSGTPSQVSGSGWEPPVIQSSVREWEPAVKSDVHDTDSERVGEG